MKSLKNLRKSMKIIPEAMKSLKINGNH